MTMHSAITLGAIVAAASLAPAVHGWAPMGRYTGNNPGATPGTPELIPNGSGYQAQGGGWGSGGQSDPQPPPQPQAQQPPPQAQQDPPPPQNPPPAPQTQAQQNPPPAPPQPPSEEDSGSSEKPWKRWRRNGKLRSQQPDYQQAQGTVQSSFRSTDDSGDNGQGSDAVASASTGSGSVSSGTHTGHGTHFEGMGHSGPISACGVPTDMYVDDAGTPLPFCALNTNSEFKDGVNCGRWLEVKLGKNCVGGGNTPTSACSASMQADGDTGKIMHLYVSDMCPDNNWWCKSDTYHIDIGEPYLRKMGYLDAWNGREIIWSYMNGPPPEFKMNKIKYVFKDGSKYGPNEPGFYASLVVVGVRNGISYCNQKVGGSWMKAEKLNELGQQWVLNQPPDAGQPNCASAFDIECFDVDEKSYGAVNVKFPCSGVCGEYTTAEASAI